MTSSTNADENGAAPRNPQPSSPSAGADRVPNDSESRGGVQPPPVAPSAARRRSDAMWGGLATAVAVAAMLWIAYQSNVRNDVAQVQKQIAAQHAESVAEFHFLGDKIQEITTAQSQTDAEIAKLVRQSPSAKSEIQGLQNHVDTLRRSPKAQKR